MSDELSMWLERSAPAIADALATKLYARPHTVFRMIGEPACQALARELSRAMRADVPSGQTSALRDALTEMMRALAPKGLGFSALRQLLQALRAVTIDATATAEFGNASHRAVESWLYQGVMLASMQLYAYHEAQMQEQAARLEVNQLESQLDDLKVALDEKTRLLDVIRAVSTPIVPIHDGVLVVPLIGVLDHERATLLTERVLKAIVATTAQVILLDLSGVPVFDAQAAEMLVRTGRAVRLLGAELILVGLSSAIARTIVELDVDLAGITTLSTLQAGLGLALSRRELRIGPIEPSPDR